MKAIASILARESLLRDTGPDRAPPDAPQKTEISSRACVQHDFHQDWFLYWCDAAGFARTYHRKVWEHVFVMQTLHNLDLLQKGRSGLGFGVGLEVEPALFAKWGVSVLATDLEVGEGERWGWNATHQHASTLERLHREHVLPWEEFREKVRFRPADMNNIPPDLDGQFDFCWSSCALEHLGSIRKGADFVKNSLRPLKPGGFAVHTTEFNFMDSDETLDNWATVLFRRRDLEELAADLTAAGHYVYPLDFALVTGPLDLLIDMPPYPHEGGAPAPDFHLRLSVDGFACTSYGIVVRKAA